MNKLTSRFQKVRQNKFFQSIEGNPKKSVAAAILIAFIASRCNETVDLSSYDADFENEAVERLVDEYGEEIVVQAMEFIESGHDHKEDENKEQIRSEILQNLRSQFSNRIHIPRLFGYCDDPRELEQIATILKYIQIAKEVDSRIELTPQFIIAAMSNEGALLDVDRYSDSQQINGFNSAGLDIFSDEFEEIVDRGLIENNFNTHFSGSQHTNELNQQVQSANFVNKYSAIKAFVATIANRQIYFLNHLRDRNINLGELSDDERAEIVNFFTYIYYNAGATVGHRIVSRFNSITDVVAYFNRSRNNPSSINLQSAPANAYVVTSGARYLSEVRD